MEVRRIGPDRGFVDAVKRIESTASGARTSTAGNMFVRESIYTVDPETGVATIIGRLPDGSYGLQEFVNDITPPDKPSTPVAVGTVGGIIVSWDGLDTSGETTPPDYNKTQVEFAKASAPTEWTVGAVISDLANTTTVPDLETNVEYLIRLRSFDTNNNASEYSEIARATPVTPVGGDVNVDELREEFQQADADLREGLQQNEQAQISLSSIIDDLKTVKLPALESSLGATEDRLDTADDLLNNVFPSRLTAIDTKAAQAQEAADTALIRADSAVVAAGSKSKVYYSTADASGTADAGDTWRKVDSSDNVIAEWRSIGGTTWVPQKITSDAISNLDVGKLSVGSASISDLVAEKIAAGTASFQRVDINNLFVTGNSQLETVTAQRIAASVGNFISLNTDNLTAGTALLDEAVARKFAAETGSFMKLSANQLYIGQGGNFLYDPQFTDTQVTAYRMNVSTGTWELVPGTATAANAVRTTTTTTNNTFHFYRLRAPSAAQTSEMISVTPGQVYDFSVDITTDISANCRWNLYIQRSDGTVSYTGMTQSTGTGRRELKYSYIVPDGVVGLFPALACLTTGVQWTIHGNATFREKITPSLIVDGFFQGQRVIGASIETNAAIDAGIKLNDDRLVSHGIARFEYSNGTVEATKMRAVLESRVGRRSMGPEDKWPGLWFESSPVQGESPLLHRPGISIGDSGGNTISILSGSAGARSPYTELNVSPNGLYIDNHVYDASGADTPAIFAVNQTYSHLSMGKDAAGQPTARLSLEPGWIILQSKTGISLQSGGTITTQGGLQINNRAGGIASQFIGLYPSTSTTQPNSIDMALRGEVRATDALTLTTKDMNIAGTVDTQITSPLITFTAGTASGTMSTAGGVLFKTGTAQLDIDSATGPHLYSSNNRARISGGSSVITAHTTGIFLSSTKVTTRYGLDATVRRVPTGVLGQWVLTAAASFTTTKKAILNFNVRAEKDSYLMINVHIHASASVDDCYTDYTLEVGGTQRISYTKPYAKKAYGDTTVFTYFHQATATGNLLIRLNGQVVVTTGTVSLPANSTHIFISDLGGDTTNDFT